MKLEIKWELMRTPRTPRKIQLAVFISPVATADLNLDNDIQSVTKRKRGGDSVVAFFLLAIQGKCEDKPICAFNCGKGDITASL